MHTGDDTLRLVLAVERRRACQPCGASDAVDACLAGTWQMTGGGPVEWMRSQGMPITNIVEGPRIVTFRSGGAYATEPLDISLEFREEDILAQGDGYLTVAFGRWSASEGVLNICQDAGGLTGSVTTTSQGGSYTTPVAVPGEGEITMRYSCAGGALTTSMAFPGLPDMVTDYGKIAEELPPDLGP
jgi:hypothetical protein